MKFYTIDKITWWIVYNLMALGFIASLFLVKIAYTELVLKKSAVMFGNFAPEDTKKEKAEVYLGEFQD